MKATLEFTLPEESDEHLCAVHGRDWRCVVLELDQQLRNHGKYGHSDLGAFKAGDGALIDAIRSFIRKEAEDRGVIWP